MAEETVKKVRVTALKDVSKRMIELMGQANRKEISLRSALMELGWPKSAASRGWTLVRSTRCLRDALAAAKAEELYQLRADDVQKVEAEQDMAIINARLRENVTSGSDAAVQSCKLLGSRKDLNMWTADSVAGMIVISSTQLPELSTFSGKTLDAREIPALSS